MEVTYIRMNTNGSITKDMPAWFGERQGNSPGCVTAFKSKRQDYSHSMVAGGFELTS